MATLVADMQTAVMIVEGWRGLPPSRLKLTPMEDGVVAQIMVDDYDLPVPLVGQGDDLEAAMRALVVCCEREVGRKRRWPA